MMLDELPEWDGDGTQITRTVQLGSFMDAIAVVDRVAVVAEEMDHHPDIDIRWRTLTFRCSTHSAGKVTDRDFALARRIDEIVANQA
jgi:4a-hydroxytetrahydrobiopterin dehydratase